jgi:hypothetical protein
MKFYQNTFHPWNASDEKFEVNVRKSDHFYHPVQGQREIIIPNCSENHSPRLISGGLLFDGTGEGWWSTNEGKYVDLSSLGRIAICNLFRTDYY